MKNYNHKMIDKITINKILSLEGDYSLLPEDMTKDLVITFYPYDRDKISINIKNFAEKLEYSLKRSGVKVVPFEEALHDVPIYKILRRIVRICLNNIIFLFQFFLKKDINRIWINFETFLNALKRRRIRPGVSVVALGENKTGDLPMEKISSFVKSSIVTVIDLPLDMDNQSTFRDHFEFAMNGFAYHLTNIIIAANKNKFVVYNFNLSHPFFKIDKNFDKNILFSLIPKIASPIKPRKSSDFVITKRSFILKDEIYADAVEDLLQGGALLERVKLYPSGKKVSEMPFRNEYHRWIGKIHLDNRSGMSYGFLARQLPTKLENILTEKEVLEKFGFKNKKIFVVNKDYYIKIEIKKNEVYYLKVPEVWVLTQKSGCDKTNMDPEQDILKLGLVNGKLHLRTSSNNRSSDGYKTSFDTDVIMAHALGNAIIASILNHFFPNSYFPSQLKSKGMAIIHWHGYLNRSYIPEGFILHGLNNPHVSCSSPQSAFYALNGKLDNFLNYFLNENQEQYKGDIHVEPQHGTNIIFPSLKEFGDFVNSNPKSTSLGNEFL